jgi:hypothetical protein
MGSNHPKACQLYLQNLFLNICANTLAATVLNKDFSHINFILVKEHNIILGTFFFMKGWGRGVKEKHPWIMHIWDVGWCPPKQPHLQACISGLSPRRWKSNAWESCLVQASLHGCKPDRPKDIRLCTTDPVGIQFSIGGDV